MAGGGPGWGPDWPRGVGKNLRGARSPVRLPAKKTAAWDRFQDQPRPGALSGEAEAATPECSASPCRRGWEGSTHSDPGLAAGTSDASNVLPAAAPLSGGVDAAAERPRDPAECGGRGVGRMSLWKTPGPGLLSLFGFPIPPSPLSQPPRLPGAQVMAGNALCNLVPEGLK